MKPLTNLEFKDALKKGLGRAILHVREYGDQGIEKELKMACLENFAYDRQCEESRGEWTMRLLELSGNKGRYFPEVLKRILLSKEFWDVYHMMELLVFYSQEGNQRAREVIFEKFEKCEFKEEWLGGDQIIEMDGLNGLLYVIKSIGTRILKNNLSSDEKRIWADPSIIEEYFEKFGRAGVIEKIKEAAKTSPEITAYLDDAYEENPWFYIPDKKPRTHIPDDSLEEILEIIEEGNLLGVYRFTKFGEKANETDLKIIFQRLLLEDREEQLKRLLSVFRKRKPPEWNDKLIEFTQDESEMIRGLAYECIANFKSDQVRNFALKKITTSPESITDGSILLFLNNYQAGDSETIETSLSRIDIRIHDDDDMHYICWNLLDLWEHLKKSELENILLWIYEMTPCSSCRGRVVKGIFEIGNIEQKLIEEFQWDCNPEIRKMANSTW